MVTHSTWFVENIGFTVCFFFVPSPVLLNYKSDYATSFEAMSCEQRVCSFIRICFDIVIRILNWFWAIIQFECHWLEQIEPIRFSIFFCVCRNPKPLCRSMDGWKNVEIVQHIPSWVMSHTCVQSNIYYWPVFHSFCNFQPDIESHECASRCFKCIDLKTQQKINVNKFNHRIE